MGRLENGGSSSDLMIQSHLHRTCRYLQPVSRRARDSRWAALRNTIISMYEPSHLATLVPTMQQVTESATQSLHSHKEEDIIFSNLSLKLSTDVIRLAAFGIDFGLSKPPTPAPSSLVITRATTHEVSDFINEHVYSTKVLKMDLSGSLSMIIGLLVPLLQEPFRRMLKLIPCTMDWKVERTDKKLSRWLNDIVSKRIQETERGLKDFLSLIFNARDLETVSRKVFTLDYITALTYEHLLAGLATTAFILSSVVYLVVGHPEVEKKLLDEIDGYGAHDLQDKFPYLNQVIKEAMSFYKVSPLIARETVASVEVGGYLLPKGTWVWLAPGVLARDPKNFPDADKFRPERFDLNGEEEKKRHPYAHIPFGIGPRACIGQKITLQKIKLSIYKHEKGRIFSLIHWWCWWSECGGVNESL